MVKKYMEHVSFPIRINRYLAIKGFATRRGADELITKRWVTINGRIALLGDIVQKTDIVEVKKTAREKRNFAYIAYHKPVGIITQSPKPANGGSGDAALNAAFSPQRRERSIGDMISKEAAGLFPVGRLDKDSSGLLILTNDGRITDRLLNPKYQHQKEYIVETDKKITPHVLRLLERGVDIEGYHTKPSHTQFVADHKFRITLYEGKKHQIRRMLAALGLQVRSLKRIRIMNIELGKMKEGEMRRLTEDEIKIFLSTLGLATNVLENRRRTDAF